MQVDSKSYVCIHSWNLSHNCSYLLLWFGKWRSRLILCTCCVDGSWWKSTSDALASYFYTVTHSKFSLWPISQACQSWFEYHNDVLKNIVLVFPSGMLQLCKLNLSLLSLVSYYNQVAFLHCTLKLHCGKASGEWLCRSFIIILTKNTCKTCWIDPFEPQVMLFQLNANLQGSIANHHVGPEAVILLRHWRHCNQQGYNLHRN